MMTGDAYNLPIRIETTEGVVSPSMFAEIEVFVGDVRKTLTKEEITFDEERQMFLVPLSQKETFRMRDKEEVQIRCKFVDGSVKGVSAGEIDIVKSVSKVVL